MVRVEIGNGDWSKWSHPSFAMSATKSSWLSSGRKKTVSYQEGFKDNLRMREVVEFIKSTKTTASWWIDRRDGGYSWIENLLVKEYEALQKEQAQAPKQVVEDAKIEATVRPENPHTETVAEIRALEKAVEITFPEKRDDFREVVKGMGYKWDNGHWQRKLFAKNGTPTDRAAEAGHRLLVKGFIVRIYDEGIRVKAIAGGYEPECTRWIQKRDNDDLDKGKYAGWLAIAWGRKDDFYRAAKRIKGARWSKPSVVVPVENYEEVLDFAQMYGFRVSQAAQEAIDAARVARDNALTVSISQPDAQSGVMADRLPPVLDVPQEVEIDEDLRDNN